MISDIIMGQARKNTGSSLYSLEFTGRISRLVDRLSDIMAHILILKLHPLCRSIGVLSGFLQVFSLCGDAKHTAAVCHDLSVVD